MAYVTIAELREYLGIEETTTFTADAATDNLTLASVPFVNTLQTGTEVLLTTSAADLPAPLAINTVYYVILVADQVIQLATSSANATAGTEIDITDAGTGTHTITRTPAETDLLTEAITDAEATVNAQTNRVFEATTLTKYYRRDSVLEWNTSVLWINDDLLTVTELLNGDADNTEIVAANYWLLDRNDGPPYHAIELLRDSGIFWEFDIDQWVSVTGTWGYSATVPADVKRAEELVLDTLEPGTSPLS